jgi:hypothetical protein
MFGEVGGLGLDPVHNNKCIFGCTLSGVADHDPSLVGGFPFFVKVIFSGFFRMVRRHQHSMSV